MAFGFEVEPNLQAYGDDGKIVLEMYADNECDNLIGRVIMTVQRFEFLIDHADELVAEAYQKGTVCRPD